MEAVRFNLLCQILNNNIKQSIAMKKHKRKLVVKESEPRRSLSVFHQDFYPHRENAEKEALKKETASCETASSSSNHDLNRKQHISCLAATNIFIALIYRKNCLKKLHADPEKKYGLDYTPEQINDDGFLTVLSKRKLVKQRFHFCLFFFLKNE